MTIPVADTRDIERETEQRVYAIHGLTPEEIVIIEGRGKVEAPSAAAIVESTGQ